MDTFRIIYKILRYLESCMGQEEIDTAPLGGEALHVGQEKIDAMIAMLVKDGYIDGVTVKYFIHSRVPIISGLAQGRITLKGMEYLQENSVMKKVAGIAKGFVEFIPLG